MSTEGERLFEATFLRVCGADFAQHIDALRLALLAPGWALVCGTLPRGQREYNRLCAAFFERTRVRWPRYEAHLREWPPEPVLDDDDEPIADPPADWREMGELLAHRIVMAYHAETKRQRLLDNADDRPVWRLVAIEDGRTAQQCMQESRELHHCRSEFWQRRQLPCERLLCRCRITALTIKEAAQFLVDGADVTPP